jgi:polyferredoxin
MESLEQCMECLEVLIIMPPATTEMKAAITEMKITKDTEVAMAMTMTMNMEEHILVVTVAAAVVMLLLFVANSKLDQLAVLMITNHAAGMIVVAATPINSFAIDLNKSSNIPRYNYVIIM